jgi:hypothetical protein
MAGLVVLFEQVAAEIAGEIAPDGVDVVVVVLRVVVLDEECGRLYAVVVAFAALHAAGPSEVDGLAGLLDLSLAQLCDLFRHVIGVLIEQGGELCQLARRLQI